MTEPPKRESHRGTTGLPVDSPIIPCNIKFVQHNMARSMAVSDELRDYCERNHIDIALAVEPYSRQGKLSCLEEGSNRVVKSKSHAKHGVWAAIVVFNPKLSVLAKSQLMNEYFADTNITTPGQSPVDVVSGYFQFRKETATFTSHLLGIGNGLASRTVLGLDVNAFSTRWFHSHNNAKGATVEIMIDDMRLAIKNRPDQPWTFQGHRGRGNIDVTLTSNTMSHNVRDGRNVERSLFNNVYHQRERTTGGVQRDSETVCR